MSTYLTNIVNLVYLCGIIQEINRMETPEKKSSIIPKIILPLILIAAGYYGYKRYVHAQAFETTENAQVETYTVPVVPRVGGYVTLVNMKDFGTVKKGELLLEIDNQEQKLALAEMEATYKQLLTDVESAKATIESAKLSLNAAEANTQATVLRKEKALRDVERDAKLLADNAITKRQADDSKANLDIIGAQYDGQKVDLIATRGKFGVFDASLHRAEAALAVQKARMEQQKLKITYSRIYAAESGKIGRKSVEPGQIVQVGQTVATIVQDSLYWVIANFKETQIRRLAVGQVVSLKLDAYPDLEVKGKIVDFSDATGAKYALLPPDNASGNFVKVTQKIPVKIAIDNVDKIRDKLHAGMSLEAEVKIK